jgi:hypothetical protein
VGKSGIQSNFQEIAWRSVCFESECRNRLRLPLNRSTRSGSDPAKEILELLDLELRAIRERTDALTGRNGAAQSAALQPQDRDRRADPGQWPALGRIPNYLQALSAVPR